MGDGQAWVGHGQAMFFTTVPAVGFAGPAVPAVPAVCFAGLAVFERALQGALQAP
jgi:hypothetical protein